ncbi:hypothetical protein ACLOJK_006352 [Asimina triloba]
MQTLELGALVFKSITEGDPLILAGDCQNEYLVRSFLSPASVQELQLGIQLQDIYDRFKIDLTGFEVKMMVAASEVISVIERFDSSVTIGLCVFLDEPMMKQLEKRAGLGATIRVATFVTGGHVNHEKQPLRKESQVHAMISSLGIHFSKSIFDSIIRLIAFHDLSKNEYEVVYSGKCTLQSDGMEKANGSSVFHYSVCVNLDHAALHLNLEDNAEDSLILAFVLEKIGILFNFEESVEEYLVCASTLKASAGSLSTETGYDLCSSKKSPSVSSIHQPEENFEFCIMGEAGNEKSASVVGFFLLHHQARRSTQRVNEYTICLNDLDLHCYPRIVGLLVDFCDKISKNDSPDGPVNASLQRSGETTNGKLTLETEFQKYGFSNYYEAGSSSVASIPLDHFPFVTICNSGSLLSLDKSLIHGIPDWRRLFHVRNRSSFRSQRFGAVKNPRKSNISAVRTILGTDVSLASNCLHDAEMFVVNLNINGIRVHFHDASCILGSLTIPIANSSIFSYGFDSWDILCSVEGLILSSSWLNSNARDFVWGQAFPDIFPVLNFRVKKGRCEALSPPVEVCIGIQHVCCILSSEFLAMLLGYFSLPDWNFNKIQKPAVENDKCEGNNHFEDYGIIYKIEILDSALVLPSESNTQHYLQLGLQQLYCSLIPMSNSTNALKDIPEECVVPTHKFVDTIDLFNIFGRDISLSLMLLEDGKRLMKIDQDSGLRSISLIESLNADLWVRIPCEPKSSGGELSASTCLMMRVESCEVIAEEAYMLCGLEEVAQVMDLLSRVGPESQGFTSDVLQFVQFKRNLKEESVALNDYSTETFLEAGVCVDSLSIKLHRSRSGSMSSEIVAVADMELKFTMSFRNGVLLDAAVDVPVLLLYSFHSSTILMSAPCINSAPSCLRFHFSKSKSDRDELLLTISSLDAWLHLSDWVELVELLYSYSRQSDKSSSMITLQDSNSGVHLQGNPQPYDTPSGFSSRKFMQASVLIVKSEKLSISFHLPLFVHQEVLDHSIEANCQQEMPQKLPPGYAEGKNISFQAKSGKYIAFNLCSQYSELAIHDRSVTLKSSIEKITGMLEVIDKQIVSSFPFFQLYQIDVQGEVTEAEKSVCISSELKLETVDAWLSHQIFLFWRGIDFRIPESTSSQLPIHNMVVKVHLRKALLLLNDGRWSSNGPILEILLRNLVVEFNQREFFGEASVLGDFQVNYNNIHKVMWEPFVEPWKFQLSMVRNHDQNPLNMSVVTDICLKSAAQLNFTVTEPFIEALFRLNEVIEDVWSHNGSQNLLRQGIGTTDNVYRNRYAPYILQNETSMPLFFWVSCGVASVDDSSISEMKEGNIVHPGSSTPIYIDEVPEEQVFLKKSSNSSERLNEKKSSGVAHHMICIQLDGTCRPSMPMSMDLVGLSYFEVDFSKPSDTIETEEEEEASSYERTGKKRDGTYNKGGFVVPVVFEVSMHHYSKLIRLYSTVVLVNATSVPLELRFDIPFGVSPKVLDPIYPGQEFPLPVHLAEAGRMRWRPLGTNYLWSEAQQLSNLLSQENRLGFLRSFVCYPSHPSSDPFRCCISIEAPSLASSATSWQTATKSCQMQNPKKRLIHIVRLTTPLLVKSYLPKQLSLTMESGGITRSIFLSEVGASSVFHIDSTHDLGLIFHLQGFKRTISKFPRAETFTTMAKLNQSKFSLTETLTFYPDAPPDGPLYVSVEKVMDVFCGARELCISIPFLLYNCTGLPLAISDFGSENSGTPYAIPSCYNIIGLEKLLSRKKGLAQLYTDSNLLLNTENLVKPSNNDISSLMENSSLHSRGIARNKFISLRVPFCSLRNGLGMGNQLNLFDNAGNADSFVENAESRKAKALMYSPSNLTAGELVVKLCTYSSEAELKNFPSSMWSSPFFLVPPSGSTSVIIPQSCTPGAFILSVTSTLVAGALIGRTRAITFQPSIMRAALYWREVGYVISNACSKDFYYKQKGTNISYFLGVGQHSHLHWADIRRDLLVCIRFNEPGWQWSGSFLPDQLGDAQLKMHNYVSGAVRMVRVEVQNADVSTRDEKIVGSSSGNAGTCLILLCDDNTGFMPYRIDNFSMEVPGERVVGSYNLDDAKDHIPVFLPSTSELVLLSYDRNLKEDYFSLYMLKEQERYIFESLLYFVYLQYTPMFLEDRFSCILQVLSIVDSNYHIVRDMMETVPTDFKEKKLIDQRKDTHIDFNLRVSIHVSFTGISLIDSFPQLDTDDFEYLYYFYRLELAYICAKDTKIDVQQSLERQKVSFQISLLQMDNQLRNTAYPVMLSFDEKIKVEAVNNTACKSTCEPVFCLAASKWRNKESSLVSFEYVNIRVAPLYIELEEQVLLHLVDFLRSVGLSFQSQRIQSELQNLGSMGAVKEWSANAQDCDLTRKSNSSQLQFLKVSRYSESSKSSPSLPSVVPIGAPWQQIFLLAGRQKKIYVEVFDLAPIKLTVSFSSTPWMFRNEGHMAAESLVHVGSIQRGLMALVDVEGVPVYLRQLTISHHLASWESIQGILVKHYTRQLIHEIYKFNILSSMNLLEFS